MKKFFLILLSVMSVCLLCSCGADKDDTVIPSDEKIQEQTIAATFELAMITDGNDMSLSDPFITNTWKGVEKYAKENGISYTYYVPAEVSDKGYITAIGKAVENGAKLIVLPNSLFEVAVYDAQYRYPDVNFIIIDGEPRTADYKTYTIESNVNAIFFSEQEAGFLAGYAAVKNGQRNLGFIGGMALSPVVRYGYGFIAGAKQAAAENKISSINIKYTYSGEFVASEDIQTLAASWYSADTEVIFACGGSLGKSVSAAAEASGSYMIGADVDESELSSSVITSALKKTDAAVYKSIESYYNGEFHGGVIDRYSAADECVGLEINHSRMTGFSDEQYDAILSRLIRGEITLPDENTTDSAAKLSGGGVKVTIVE